MSPAWKFWDIHFAGTDAPKLSWEFCYDHLTTVAMTQSQTLWCSGHLTSASALTWDGLWSKSACKVQKRCKIKCAQNGSAAHQFLGYSWKTQERGVQTPPIRIRVKSLNAIGTYNIAIMPISIYLSKFMLAIVYRYLSFIRLPPRKRQNHECFEKSDILMMSSCQSLGEL